MVKMFFLGIALCIGQIGFSQEFSYTFSLAGVSEPGEAKMTINDIRELLGVTVVKFNDGTDQFEILTHLDWEVAEMTYDLESIGYTLVGTISKINLE